VLLFLAGRFLNNYNYFPFYGKVCVVDPTNIAKAVLKEELEDTKGVIRIRISKNRQHNGQKKKYKRINNDLQN
jgi:hypothetical protein